ARVLRRRWCLADRIRSDPTPAPAQRAVPRRLGHAAREVEHAVARDVARLFAIRRCGVRTDRLGPDAGTEHARADHAVGLPRVARSTAVRRRVAPWERPRLTATAGRVLPLRLRRQITRRELAGATRGFPGDAVDRKSIIGVQIRP